MADPQHQNLGGGEPPINAETGTGVEVIQLANGDIIWFVLSQFLAVAIFIYFRCLLRNVVNGLRDDDEESLYTGRTSFGSEYSQDNSSSMQVFVKEHGRSSSKGSQASFMSRKKLNGGKSRPETKVRIQFQAP